MQGYGYHQASRSPATRLVYTSMFRAPQWHGAMPTHCPPRPRKSAWHCDITNVIRHTVCPRHARSPQRVVRAKPKTQSHLHFAPSTRTIAAQGCAVQIQNAISPAFRALDTHDCRRWLRFVVLRRRRPRLKRERKEGREDPQM